MKTSTDLIAAKLFSCNHKGMFQQDSSRYVQPQLGESPGWMQIKY